MTKALRQIVLQTVANHIFISGLLEKCRIDHMLEEVALSVIDDVLSAGQSMIEACMLPGLDPLERVTHSVLAFSSALVGMAPDGKILGCPIGRLCSELGPRNEAVRLRVSAAFRHMQSTFASCFEEASTAQPDLAAAQIISAIQGMAVLGLTLRDPTLLNALARASVPAAVAGAEAIENNAL